MKPRWRSHLQGWAFMLCWFFQQALKILNSPIIHAVSIWTDDLFVFFWKMRNMHSAMGSAGDPFTASGGPAPPVLLHLMKLEGKLFKQGKLSIFVQKPKQWGSKIICNNTDKNRTWVPTDAKSLYSSKDPNKRAMLLLPHLWNGEVGGQQWGTQGGTGLVQALLRCPVYTNTYASAVQTK